MATKKRAENNKKNQSDRKYFSISSDKKKRITGIFLILFSLFLLLSIISYDRRDEVYLDYLLFFGVDTHNWLGMIGAHLSHFFIKSTIGYFSIVFSAVLFLWGISFFKMMPFKILIHTSNLLIVSGLLFASFFGVLKIGFNLLPGIYEMRGSIGDSLGGWLIGLLGGIGSILLLFFLSSAVLIFAFDIKIESLYHFIKNMLAVESDDKITIIKKEDDESNLEKIKKLHKEKKRPEVEERDSLTAEDLMEEEAGSQTNIQIIRKEEPELPEDDEISIDERKKVDLEKTGELPDKKLVGKEEKELPEPWEEELDYELPGLDLLQPPMAEDIKVAEEELTKIGRAHV